MENLLARLRETISKQQDTIPPDYFCAEDLAGQDGWPTTMNAIRLKLKEMARHGIIERKDFKRYRNNRLYRVAYYRETKNGNASGHAARRNRGRGKSA